MKAGDKAKYNGKTVEACSFDSICDLVKIKHENGKTEWIRFELLELEKGAK